ncbi:MAG: hypothetical protein V1776_03015 [Candidatus Diapherotrites archaeon]
MNTRGQAFSTFQLLIAAVVALAILVLLLNIIGSLPNLGGQKPNKVASDLVASQVNAPSELRTSNSVTFTREDSLNAQAIASASQVVTQGQLCLSLGDFPEDGDFTTNDSGNIIKYAGSSNLRVRLSVICDTGTELIDDLTDNGIVDDWTSSNSACGDVTSLSQTACIVALRFA